MVDGLTPLFSFANFDNFVTMTRVKDKKNLLALIEKKKNLKKTIKLKPIIILLLGINLIYNLKC